MNVIAERRRRNTTSDAQAKGTKFLAELLDISDSHAQIYVKEFKKAGLKEHEMFTPDGELTEEFGEAILMQF